MTQHYGNHGHRPVRFLIAFGFIFAAAICFVLGLFDRISQNWTIAALVAGVGTVAWAARRAATSLQDRIIRNEMRYRTDALLSAEHRGALWTLSTSQIVALRFASDEELPELIARASKEQLSNRDIKQAVKNWVPDLNRT